jgi:hypothetical protein
MPKLYQELKHYLSNHSQPKRDIHPGKLEPRTYSMSTSQATDSSIPSSVPEQKAPKDSASQPFEPPLPPVNMGNQVDHIHHFLKSCSPSMEHLLSCFVNLGFRSVDILKEVACSWTGNERLEILKKLRVPEGGQISELELIVLERRFQKYSLENLNGM